MSQNKPVHPQVALAGYLITSMRKEINVGSYNVCFPGPVWLKELLCNGAFCIADGANTRLESNRESNYCHSS